MIKKCQICDTPFERSKGPGNPNKRFCSRACQLEFQKAEKRNRNGHGVGVNKLETEKGETKHPPLSPASWAAAVFKKYELDDAQQQLVMMGLEALTIARDPEEDWKIKNTAMGRFQAIISQLNLPKLEEEEEEIPEDTPIITAARPIEDPRQKLRVVS